MNQPSDRSNCVYQLSGLDHIDLLCDQFEAAYQRGQKPPIEDYLARARDGEEERLFGELLKLEIALLRRDGQSPDWEDYQKRFPDRHLPNEGALELTNAFADQAPVAVAGGNQTADNIAARGLSSGRSKQIGPYRLLQPIGQGGMGEVWMAEQEKPVRRRVALKLIKAGLDNKQIIARFQAEHQALAMMDHQNIAKVFDAGATEDGLPYFVMELVQGIPFNQYCNQHKLSINERLELFIPVCHAIQHAHQKGIIHRDLKPSNVLVCLYDGQPVAKVIDFGLAKALQHTQKLTDKTLFTEFGQVVGTLQYMSPEQAEMNQLDIDTRTDIYSLGVMLYELLTGSTPIEADSLKHNAFLQVLATIREQDPPRPSVRLSSATNEAVSGISAQRQIDPAKLKSILRGELDWIVMKALEKDRTRRYDTANAFAADVANYLNGNVVTARPPSTGYRLKKYVRRHRGLVASLVSIATLLVIATIGTSWLAIEANRARKVATTRTNEALAEKEKAEAERTRADLKTKEAIASSHAEAAARAQAVQNAEKEQAARAEADRLREEAQQALARESVLRENESAAKELAERQQEIAHQNLLQARRAIDDYFTLVSQSDLLNVPGLQPLRRELLVNALEYYEQFAQQASDDPIIQAELAKNYLRVGEVTNAMAEGSEATKYLRKGLEIIVNLNSDYPERKDWKIAVAGVYTGPHFFFGGARVSLSSYPVLMQAIKIYESFVSDHPDVVGLKSDLAGMYFYFFIITPSKTRLFERTVDRTIQLWEELLAIDPKSTFYRTELARTCVHAGQLTKDKGEPLLERANGILEGLLAEGVDNHEQRMLQARNFLALASLLHKMNRVDDAEQAYRKAMPIGRRLILERPSSLVIRNAVYAGVYEYSEMLVENGRREEAEAVTAEWIGGLREVLSNVPKNSDFLGGIFHSLSRSLYRLATLQKETGKQEETLESLKQARDASDLSIAEFEKASERTPELALDQYNAHRLLRVLLHELKDYQQAALTNEKLLGHLRSLTADELKVLGWKRMKQLELTRDSLQWVIWYAEVHTQAISQFTIDSVEELQQATSDQPEAKQIYHDCAWMWNNIAGVYAKSGELDKAFAAFDEGMKILESIITKNSGDVIAKIDLAGLTCNRGERFNENEKKIEAYGSAIDLLVEALEQHPGQEKGTRFLAININSFVRVSIESGDISKCLQKIELGLKYVDPANENASSNLVSAISSLAGGLLSRGEFELHNEMCRSTASRFAAAENAVTCNSVAWTLVRLPLSGELAEQAVSFGERAIAKEPENGFHLNTLGVALYRAGRFQESIDRLIQSMGKKNKNDDFWNWLFLSMAHHQLGNSEEAKSWLDKTRQWLLENHPEFALELGISANASEIAIPETLPDETTSEDASTTLEAAKPKPADLSVESRFELRLFYTEATSLVEAK